MGMFSKVTNRDCIHIFMMWVPCAVCTTLSLHRDTVWFVYGKFYLYAPKSLCPHVPSVSQGPTWMAHTHTKYAPLHIDGEAHSETPRVFALMEFVQIYHQSSPHDTHDLVSTPIYIHTFFVLPPTILYMLVHSHGTRVSCVFGPNIHTEFPTKFVDIFSVFIRPPRISRPIENIFNLSTSMFSIDGRTEAQTNFLHIW